MFFSSQYSTSQSEEVKEPLISESSRARRFKLNDAPTYGIYNRSDFMARCHRACWKMNGRDGPTLRRLLWFGGKASKSGNCLSTFFFVLVLVLPFFALFWVVGRPSRHWHEVLMWCVVVVEVLLLIWNCYCLFAILSNFTKWDSCWFTFKVNKRVLGPVRNSIGDRFFDIRQHMKYCDVTRETIGTFPLLTVAQRRHVASKFEQHSNISQFRLILYSGRFLNVAYRCPRLMAIALLCLSSCAVGLMTYLCYYYYREQIQSMS